MTKNRNRPSLVYMAINLINGKRYVGVTCTGLGKRKTSHRYAASYRTTKNNLFHNAIRKYGFDAFSFSVLKECLNFDTALSEEIRLIALLKPEYNLTKGGEGHLGYSPSAETRLKLSQFHTGKKWPGRKLSAQTKEKLRIIGIKNRDRFLKNVGTKSYELSRKPVVCLNDGKIFISVNAAAAHYDVKHASISRMCKGVKRFQTIEGRKFAYYTGQLISIQPIEIKETEKRIMCLNDGKIFERINIAAKHYNINRTNISAICRGKQRTVNGLTFMYLPRDMNLDDAAKKAEFEKRHFEKNKKVICLDDDKVFESLAECAKFYGVRYTSIREVCKGVRRGIRKLGGKRFAFYDTKKEAA